MYLSLGGKFLEVELLSQGEIVILIDVLNFSPKWWCQFIILTGPPLPANRVTVVSNDISPVMNKVDHLIIFSVFKRHVFLGLCNYMLYSFFVGLFSINLFFRVLNSFRKLAFFLGGGRVIWNAFFFFIEFVHFFFELYSLFFVFHLSVIIVKGVIIRFYIRKLLTILYKPEVFKL